MIIIVTINTYTRNSMSGPLVVWEAVSEDGMRWTCNVGGYITVDDAIRAAKAVVHASDWWLNHNHSPMFTHNHKLHGDFPTEPTIPATRFNRR